jgi:hypothetical protein
VPQFESKKDYEDHLIHNEEARLKNVGEQIDNILIAFVVYFLFLATLLT